MKFHEFLLLRRKRLGLSKKDLAIKAGISDAYIKHIEDGMRIPKDILILYSLADALQVNREWFRDYAYFHRDPKWAGRYVDTTAVLEGEEKEGRYYNPEAYPSANLVPIDREIVEALQKLNDDQKNLLLKYIQTYPSFDGLIFEGIRFDKRDLLYKIVQKLTRLDKGIQQKMLKYIIAMTYIETHENLSPFKGFFGEILELES
jgi:transcriptional regulator with XRE-family HTH domain